MKPKVLNEKICKLINERLADEYKAFVTYQAISNWAKGVGYTKAGEYFSKESDDELVHAKKLMAFLTDWNDVPDMPVIAKPKMEFKTLVEAIELGYQIEFDLYTAYEETCATIEDMDIAVYQFLSQYLEIQTKSVAEYSDMLNILSEVEPTKMNLLLLEETLFE